MVGLPDAAVRESRDRIRAAIRNAGYSFPRHHVTVNLAPADIRKEGTGFDLPIAMGILAAEGIVQPAMLESCVFTGELSLNGAVKGVPGVLPIAQEVHRSGKPGIVVPRENADEAPWSKASMSCRWTFCRDVVDGLSGTKPIEPHRVETGVSVPARLRAFPDFSEIRGQEQAKRAMEIAAAGGHNILMIGPPRVGKTMLAQRLPGILPELTLPEAIETTKIFSVAGLLERSRSLVSTRPFRSPTTPYPTRGWREAVSSRGRGRSAWPTTAFFFSTSSRNFAGNVLEALRQPMEDGVITISRSAVSTTFPARFMLVAAMNPCPCGFLGETRRRCRCSAAAIRGYQSRISGPLLDRIDLHIEVPAVRHGTDHGNPGGRLRRHRRPRPQRAAASEGTFEGDEAATNARMDNDQIGRFCTLGEESRQLLEMAMDRLGLSARAYSRILRTSRTIADLEEAYPSGLPTSPRRSSNRSLDRLVQS
jgi:magnesium chelatase family protein